LEKFNTDWTRHWRGESSLVLQPTSTTQISRILQYCQKRHLAVVPQAGNTSLVGGSVPVHDEVVLSTNRMNQVESFDAEEGVLQCQAGCVLQDLQEYVAKNGFLLPIDLGAKGTCQIGGNLSTNAGGVYYYRYGSLAGNLLGLTVVLADGGRVLRLGSPNRKDNTGYKLQQLFLGAEGTLGVITSVTLQCWPLPTSKLSVFLACPDFDSILAVRKASKKILGEVLSAMEWMDHNIMNIVQQQHGYSSLHLNLAGSNPHYLLVETHGSNEEHDVQKMTEFLEHVLSCNLATDGVLSQNVKQHEMFWKIREACNPSMASLGYTYKYDVSLPVSRFEEFVNELIDDLRDIDGVVCANWGHLLDGNLHLNFVRPGRHGEDIELTERLQCVYRGVISGGGSISAEHGIGRAKRQPLHQFYSSESIGVMQNLKRMLDPSGLLNPGKLFY